MLQKVDETSGSTFRYSTIRFVADWQRQVEIPVGVAIWRSDTTDFHIRLAGKGEHVDDVNLAEAAPHILAFEKQLHHWMQSDVLPYAERALPVLSDDWWRHAARLLRFRIRVDEPKPIDCIRPAEEVEALFDAAVRPSRTGRQEAQRLDTYVRRAIGDEANRRLTSKASVTGFEDRPVQVLKALEHADRLFIIEAVNLAGKNAERDADATASKLTRIRKGPRGENAIVATAYLASPNGLNGEGVMVDWIKTLTEAPAFDLDKEREKLRDFTWRHLRNLDPQPKLMPAP